MLALYIIAGIILLIVVLLHFPIVAKINYTDNKLDLKIKWLFFKVFPLKVKNAKPKKVKTKKLGFFKRKKLERQLKKEKKAYNKALEKAGLSSEDINSLSTGKTDNVQSSNQQENPEKNSETSSAGETKKQKKEDKLITKLKHYLKDWDHIKGYLDIGKKSVKKLVKAIKIKDVDLSIVVADEDAYKCAMSYGVVSAAVYNILALIKQFFTVTIKHIQIDTRFNYPDTEYKFNGEITVKPSTLVCIFMFILVKFIYTNVKNKKQSQKRKAVV